MLTSCVLYVVYHHFAGNSEIVFTFWGLSEIKQFYFQRKSSVNITNQKYILRSAVKKQSVRKALGSPYSDPLM